MGLFGRGKGGGLMNVIRCDEPEYLIWKWRPAGQALNSTSRENAIRFGSSLRVKDGEVAAFVYRQNNGAMQDFIVGPFDQTLQTANLPVLSSIVGMAYGGESPFQADVYFINTQGNNQIRFAIPFFDIFDPRFINHPIPVAVRGTLTFCLEDYRNFIKLNRLVNFDKNQFYQQIKEALSKYVKGVIIDLPRQMQIPAVQIESKILEINDRIYEYVKPRIQNDFGVVVRGFDIGAIDIDHESESYKKVYKLSAEQQERVIIAQNDITLQNLQDMQRINAVNTEETMRINREESQRAQRLQSETNFIGAHALNQQTDVLRTAAGSLGQMGSVDLGGGGGSMNPAGMMTGMMMGGAMGQQMAGMMGTMGQQINNAMNTPPPMPTVQYMLAVNGQTTGPFSMQQMQQLVAQGQMNAQTYVWKQGMAGWELAGNVAELAPLFMAATPPPPPPVPGGMPTPPAP